MHNQEEKIQLLEERDFSAIYSDAFRFLRFNFLHFLKTLLYIAGPFILLGAIVNAFSTASQLSSIGLDDLGMRGGSIYPPNYWLYLGITIFFRIIASLVLIGSVIEYFKLYMARGPKNFTVSDVGKELLSDFGRLIQAFVLFLLVVFAISLGVGLVVGAFGAILPPLAVVFIIALVIGMMIIGPPLMFIINSMYISVVIDRTGFGGGIARARYIMKDNFWWTWLIVAAALIMVMIVGIIFTLPTAIVSMTGVFTSMNGEAPEISNLVLILATIGDFLNTIVYSVVLVIMGFHHFSLVERTSGKGMMERIDELGSGQDYRDQTPGIV